MNTDPDRVTTTTSTTRSGPADDVPVSTNDGSRAVATNNLTWAIAMVIVLAAVAIALVYVAHSVVHMF